MSARPSSLRLASMSWIDVAAHLARDPRLLVPIGALEQHGPHLPLGTNTLLSERIAHDLSAEFRVLCAPTMPFGVNYYGVHVPVGRAYAGTATLRQKTLHRTINELLAAWERHGVAEFVILTAHRHEPHLDALATLVTARARVRVVSIWDIDVSDLLDAQPGPLHAGEAETSLMLHLYPSLVRMDRAQDAPLARGGGYDPRRLPAPPTTGSGVTGVPSAASAEKGQRIYVRIVTAIQRSVFTTPQTDSDAIQSL
ncbi:MAG: creatininase family protein [Gemmatimonadetes bacterium]|nr:creatininase family protein [Gemmatimonadota bacterium]